MNILIIGCGYIGMPLAKYFVQKGHFITATTHNPTKLKLLSKIAQKSLILKGSDSSEITHLLKENKSIIVTIAADSLEDYEEAYLKTAHSIKHAACHLDEPFMVIYTSRGIVYGDHDGRWVDETASLNSTLDKSKVLIETELTFESLKNLGVKVCILRLAEVYGPSFELSSKAQKIYPASSNFYTNMVHQEDVVRAIAYAHEHKLEGIYNIVDDDHPTRQKLFDKLLEKLNVEKVDWSAKPFLLNNGNRRESNHKIKSEGFEFKYSHRVFE